jgi:DNA helicase HerA-like ATPase
MPKAEPRVLGMTWEEFRTYFSKAWKPGEHIGLCGGTGSGKSTFAGGILDLRRYVIVADPKGGDETLAALDLRRLPNWPGERSMVGMLDKDDRQGRPSRYLVGPVVNRGEDLPKLRKAIADSLDGVFDMGGWTYYLDEAQVAADRRLMNLSGKVDKLLVAARSKGVSLVLAFQQPKWVTAAALTQPTWFAVSGTRDTDTVNRLGELMGRPKPEIRGALKGLDRFCWLIVGRNPREPLIVTKPDKIAPKRKA